MQLRAARHIGGTSAVCSLDVQTGAVAERLGTYSRIRPRGALEPAVGAQDEPLARLALDLVRAAGHEVHDEALREALAVAGNARPRARRNPRPTRSCSRRGSRSSSTPRPRSRAQRSAARVSSRCRHSPRALGAGRRDQRSSVQENRALTRFCGRRAEPVSSKPKVTRSGVLVPGISKTTQPPPQPSRSESNESA